MFEDGEGVGVGDGVGAGGAGAGAGGSGTENADPLPVWLRKSSMLKGGIAYFTHEPVNGL